MMGIIFAALIFLAAAACAAAAAVIIHRRAALASLPGIGFRAPGRRLAQYAFYLRDYLLKLNLKPASGKRYGQIAGMLEAVNAGVHMTPAYFLLLEEASALCGFAAGWLLFSGPLPALVAGAAAFFIPQAILSKKAADQAEALVRELPDAFDIISSCVEGGLSLKISLARYASTADGPFAEQLRNCLKRTDLGGGFAEALRTMEARLRVPEVTRFADVFIQADRLGGNVREVIRAQAAEMRQKRFQTLKKKAHEAPVKLLIPLILFIFPVIFIVLFGPVVIKLLNGI